MSKSRLIMIISAIALVVILGVGGFLVMSNRETNKNNIEQTENKEEKLNDIGKEDKSNNNTNNNTNNDISENKSNSNEEAQNNNSNNSTSEIGGGGGNNNSSNNGNPNSESNPPSNSNINTESNYLSGIEQAIFQRVNQERSAAGVPALSYNTTMEYYARIKSKDMGDNGYFSHEDQQGNLITVKMQADGVSYRAWAENIGYIQGMSNNSSIANKLMDNWMNSSGHRANILSTNYNSIGVGVYKIGNTYYATQEFYK